MKILVSSFVMPKGAGHTKAGVGRYVLSTLGAIARVDLGHTYDVFLPEHFEIPAEWRESPWTRWHPVAAEGARRRAAWEHFRVAGEARRLGSDLIFAPFPAVPLRSSVPVVATICDAFPRTHPEWFGPRKRLILDALHGSAARLSRRVVTISQWSKGEIARAYRVPPERIVVAPLGVGNEVRPLGAGEEPGERVDTSSVVPAGTRYLATLSTLEPRKNLGGLLQAFALLRPSHPKLKLVVIGARGWMDGPVFETVERLGIGGDVIFAGYVEDGLVGPLLREAELFVLPSFVEGFGIPALEAMAVGAPVACSDTSSLPEVVGGAAFLFDPRDPAGMARTIAGALADPGARRAKALAGLERSGRFTWEASLRATERAWAEAAGAKAVS